MREKKEDDEERGRGERGNERSRRKRNEQEDRGEEQREKDSRKKKRKSERTGKRRAKVTEASRPGRFGPVGTRWWPAALIAVRGRDVASSRRTHSYTHVHKVERESVLALACRNWRW